MTRFKSRVVLLQLCVCAIALPAVAKPYRAMVTRTAESTQGGNLEVGLRYQAFLLGSGAPASPWSQLAAHLRFGILDNLELETQVETLIRSGVDTVDVYFGDIPIGLQWTFLEGPTGALGVFGRVTLPTGPGGIDTLPPTLSDGTLDLEGTFLAEWRPTRELRLMANLGLIHHGTRSREAGAFDVPEAVKYGVAGTFNVSPVLLVFAEAFGHSFFERQITPAWDDNQHLVELIPGVRFEPIPRLVLEAALGISLSAGLQEIHRFRPLIGLTYEFGS
jgi:hypothetical protein